MKIKVEYYLPRVLVSEIIEVGAIKNMHLSKRQSKMVDELISENLHRQLISKLQQTKAKTKVKLYDK